MLSLPSFPLRLICTYLDEIDVSDLRATCHALREKIPDDERAIFSRWTFAHMHKLKSSRFFQKYFDMVPEMVTMATLDATIMLRAGSLHLRRKIDIFLVAYLASDAPLNIFMHAFRLLWDSDRIYITRNDCWKQLYSSRSDILIFIENEIKK